jgi:pimeloyl-ACP methyl ester carboxylesterase
MGSPEAETRRERRRWVACHGRTQHVEAMSALTPLHALTPFHAFIPDDVLVDLRHRLARTLFTEDLPDVGWDDGTPAAHLREQVDYWLQRFDWRAQEARLNAFPQVTTEVDGATVHLLHVRSPEADATPAILTHGWPGTVFEWLDVLGPLTDPRAHGGDPTTALHLVVPSLPGYAFSGPTRERGWGVERISDAWATLMTRLGYERFLAIGNDWGSSISLVMARKYPARLLGAHVTQIFDSLADAAARLSDPTPEERRALEGQAWFEAHMSAYQRVHAQQPISVAHALADSPAGLLGWLNIVFRGGMDLDFVLTQATALWTTRTVGSALRLYREAFRELGRHGLLPHLPPSTVPVALAGFANDTVSIRRLAAEVHRNIVAWNAYGNGSHWAAHSAPETWVADVRAFVREVRPARSSS